MDKTIIKADIKSAFSKAFIIFSYIIFIFGVVWLIPVIRDTDNIFSVSIISRGRDVESPFYVGVAIIVIFIITLILRYYFEDIARAASLELTADGIDGVYKSHGHKEQLRLPIDKVDSVMVIQSVADNIRGGKTVCFGTASGRIKFICVQNAEEFVNEVNKQIEEHKSTFAAGKTAEPNVPSPALSNADELKKYKDLLDMGAITQEEFDEKKKQLLGL